MSSHPPVEGPDGTRVGTIELRSSPKCKAVVWGRVLWNNDPAATYQIPRGWTLHVITHRPDTRDYFDQPEPSHDSPIPYALSAMMSTARGCVFVEAYFTDGVRRTASAATSCVSA
ncbi:hypothetical protein IRT45_05875 [Nocardia sp. BSTN01]|nr:hypothetical protein [Nocardia sp. BSTN01]